MRPVDLAQRSGPGPGSGGGIALEDIRDLVEIPTPVWPWIAAGTAVAALLAWGGWVWWKRTRRGAMAEMGEAPDSLALRRIREAWEDVDHADVFVVKISGAVRHYLEDAFGWHAPEQTTEEFLEQLRQDPWMQAEVGPPLADFLGQCDRVKFAGEEPSLARRGQLYEAANRLVTALVDRQRQAQAEAEAATVGEGGR
jgi:hypothetical protein